jgi:hypothetical protein
MNRVTPAPDETFMQVYQELQGNPGVILFTALQWLPETRSLRRVFTSHPDDYPTGAEKSVQISQGWLSTVIAEQKSFFAPDQAGLEEVFSDVELIRSLGCGAVINIPVVSNGRIAGVLALLHAEGHYTAQTVAVAERIVNDHADQLVAAFGSRTQSIRH